MWYRRFLAVAAVLGLVLAACQPGQPTTTGSPGPEGTPADVEQVLRYPISEPPSLDPQAATDSASINVLRSITRPLIYLDEALEITAEGGLAESWEITDGGLTVTFTLRDGIAYSDGTPIVAGDFVYAWQRLVDPRTAAGYAYVMTPVEGAGDLLGVDPEALPPDDEIDAMLEALGVEAPDDSTFVVHLTEPASYFPYIATLWVTAPVKQEWIEGTDPTEAENYVGSGPFALVEWEHNSRIVLEPNEHWYGDPPLLERLEMPIFADMPAQSWDAFLNDEVDHSGVPSANRQQVQDDADLSQLLNADDTLATYYIGFGPEGVPAESKALRHALSQSVDRTTLIETVQQGVGSPATSFVPPGMPGHQPEIGFAFDVDAAQASLDEALTELGLSDASELNLELGFNSGAGHETIMEFLQAQWQENLGITVTLAGLEWGAFLARLDEDPFEMFRLGWGADFPHPHNFLFDVFSCDSGNNHTLMCSQEYDELLLEAATLDSADEQLALYNQAQEILVDEAPAVFIYWYGSFSVTKPWVEDLTITAQDSNAGELFFDRVWISDEGME